MLGSVGIAANRARGFDELDCLRAGMAPDQLGKLRSNMRREGTEPLCLNPIPEQALNLAVKGR